MASGGEDAVSPALADFLARARQRLARAPAVEVADERGDHDLTPQFRPAPGKPARAAAVLVPVIARPAPTLLFTQRAAHLPHHPGQISFPGGKVEPFDDGPLATALREAEEEVGLDAGLVRPLGYLDAYLSRTGFRIVPVVGLVEPRFGLTLNPDEVDEAFEVPLDFLMSPANHERHQREAEGTMRIFHAMTWQNRHIWGVTGGILRNLHERVYG
ncbi:CoA pyrophosphatase [Ancylobacter terrae]|uniref:CoA pyrophosphatase n=1 Tax=Ancylobacter sp. sgz301288 TaxID=3342077 RepID=UPI00385AB5D1